MADPPADRPFPDVRATPAGHLVLHQFAAQALVASYLVQLAHSRGDDVEALHGEYPWLEGIVGTFRARMPAGVGWQDGPTWWRDRLLEWEAAVDGRLPLVALGDLAGADAAARIALVLVGLVEDDVRFGSLFESLQRPVAGRRPCIGLVEQAAALIDGAGPAIEPWLAAGFLVAEDEHLPRVERSLRVEPAVWAGLRTGSAAPPRGTQAAVGDTRRDWRDVLGDFDGTEAWSDLPGLLERGTPSIVVVRGRRGSGRRALLAAAAAHAGRSLLIGSVDADPRTQRATIEALALAAALRGELPVVDADLGPGESVDLGALAGHGGTVGVLLGREGGLTGLEDRERVALAMPAPTAATMEQAWSEGLGAEGATLDPARLAASVRLPLELARRAARGAREAARTGGRSKVEADDVRTAVRALGSSDLDRLAQRVEPRGEWADLVTSDEVLAELALIERSCLLGSEVASSLGPAFRAVEPRGTKLLLHGPSGVGKSLAVRILAARLGKDLYVADLGALHDKWVGESEKAVSRLLAAAEERDVVLLVDEGDALFGKRSSGQGANERFGNLLTNHLLTRLECFEGVIAVTTNAIGRTDPAFARRFDAVVAVPAPNLVRRVAIFARHLPADAAIDGAELARLARSGSLSGGQIRNAVLHAARVAAAESRPLGPADLERGVRRELRKVGVPVPRREPLPRGARALLDRQREARG